MAIQFGPKLPKGNSVQRQPLPKPNTPINNESKPDVTTQEHKGSIEEVENGKPGDYTIETKTYMGLTMYMISYKDKNGNVVIEGTNSKEELERITSQDSYFGR